MSQKITNWPQYNNSLINRGSITFWISEDVIKSWTSTKRSSKAGRPEKYSDAAIQAICMVRFFFHLTLRSTQGFISSLFAMMHITLPVPSYSRICRRMNGYHRRSLVEMAISRFKGILGTHLKSRRLLNQHQEMIVKSLIINKINGLGLPIRT